MKTFLGLVGKKIGMARMIDAEGQMIPVTLLQVGPQKVTKILTPERDGYSGIQIGYCEKAERKLNKPDLHRLRKAKINDSFVHFREIRCDKPIDGIEIGSPITVDALEGIVAVDACGITKGRGFQGAQTRWGFASGRGTHGSTYHNRPGSLGCRTTPGRVMKNKKMPGHFGNVQRTVQNLCIVDVDKKLNTLAIKGSVPGHREGFILIRPSIKTKEKQKGSK